MVAVVNGDGSTKVDIDKRVTVVVISSPDDDDNDDDGEEPLPSLATMLTFWLSKLLFVLAW